MSEQSNRLQIHNMIENIIIRALDKEGISWTRDMKGSIVCKNTTFAPIIGITLSN